MAQAIAAAVAAFLLIAAFWRWRAATVVEEERRRIARNLHDGLAHELTFIAGRSRASSGRIRPPPLRCPTWRPPPSVRWTSPAGSSTP
jgi:signal transduction histidine kinase